MATSRMMPRSTVKKLRDFRVAEGKRVDLTNKQRREITKIYKEAAKEIHERAEFLKGREGFTNALNRVYLLELEENIKGSLKRSYKGLQGLIEGNMSSIVTAVVKDNQKLMRKMGFDRATCGIAYSYIPEDVVQDIASGRLYKGRWSLSATIWDDEARIERDINKIIAKGIAEQKSTFAIAQDLEMYVKPGALKPWDWAKVYPGVRKVIDYNAQRLARTMVSHAYQASFVRTTQYNPFITAYQWLISNSARVCPICIDRAEMDSFGLGPGIFPKDSLPMDHPNGMCAYAIVSPYDSMQTSNMLADWAQGKGDARMNKDIDIYMQDLRSRKRA